MEENKRVLWLDSAKAFAILLVVVSHMAPHFSKSSSDFLGVLNYFICCFHMQFFFVLSGFSYPMSRQARADDTKTKVKYSVIHCLDFAWVAVLFNVIFSLPAILTGELWKNGIISVLIAWADNYWFIPILAAIYLIMPWVKKINIFILAGVLVTGLLCGLIRNVMLLAHFWLYLFCFLLGVYLHDIKNFKHGYLFGIFFLTAATIWYFLSDGAVLQDVYSKTILGVPASLFFVWLFKTVPDRAVPNWVLKVGQNTLIIYLTHQHIITRKIWVSMAASVPSAVIFLTEFLSISILTCLFIVLFEKLPLVRSILLRPSAIVARSKWKRS